MDLKLKHKTAFISGSTAGIGLATAKILASEGADVIVNGRTKKAVDEVIADLSAEFPDTGISGFACDFSKPDEITNLLKELPEIDILINNVGIFEPKAFEDIADEDWHRFFDINVMSGVRLSRHFLPKMLKKNWGRIIFISSESAIFIPDEMIHYGMTKTAQLAISRGLAELTKGTDVTVNSVLPGPTRSRGVGDFVKDIANQENISFEQMEEQFFQHMRPTSLIQRFAEPEEVATTIAYLVSPLASATNGAAIHAEGGLLRTIF
ncbi:SDR family NAD(P)-dependent oxidoreductase [Robertkochia solimangrovi]|uniref:SDR family NAD(P)-dependent oxidoreductase n=1 Tax=Robertkochia solimangrovi TaxID=2213046 RepID=UPI00117C0547|nr:SDR family oxidoreductase [Robertkochia solimangrovi]TRZ45035.1 oxidoreductase [Robertkochia solimangrovi]